MYLVVDGGRFYSLGKVGTLLHPFFVQTTLIGEYYLLWHFQMNPSLTPPLPVRFTPTPYCKLRAKRAGVVQKEQLGDNTDLTVTARLNDNKHRFDGTSVS